MSLTGEVSTGKSVMADAAGTLKAVTLELGGKSPIVVFDDADVDSALNAALTNNFFSTGQVCSNGTRVFVQRGVYEQFLEPIAERVRALTVGDPFDPDTMIGPLVSAEHREKVMRYMQIAEASGARQIVGGDAVDPILAAGNFVLPAVYADCTDDMEFVTDEVFGPLMSVLPFVFTSMHTVVCACVQTLTLYRWQDWFYGPCSPVCVEGGKCWRCKRRRCSISRQRQNEARLGRIPSLHPNSCEKSGGLADHGCGRRW